MYIVLRASSSVLEYFVSGNPEPENESWQVTYLKQYFSQWVKVGVRYTRLSDDIMVDHTKKSSWL